FGARGTAPPPADLAAVAAEQPGGGEAGLVAQRGARPGREGERRDEQRVGRAVRLAHEAGLAVVLAGDHRHAVRAAVEHVARADLDAAVAGDAPLPRSEEHTSELQSRE